MQTGGQGQVSKRKRVKGKIGDPTNKPELKFCSMINPADTGRYECEYFPGFHDEESENNQMWLPYMLKWPLEGTGKDERIGKKIRVKYLRIKGYAASSPLLIDQVRWRLVLYRTKKNYITKNSQIVEGYPMPWLYDLYRKSYSMSGNDLAAMQLACVQMYYQSYFNPQNMGDDDCKRRILMKGMFNPNEDIGNYIADPHSITGTMGNQAVNLQEAQTIYDGRFLRHFTNVDIGHVANMNAIFPIDLTVVMNDNVDTSEYAYVIVFETDCVIGQSQGGIFYNRADYANFIFSILPQIYYTDD